ncbi:MAG: glutathione S-transferase [Rhodospirillaceae bacterium]|jgi:GST-like protein|nr:glutathione S-transferase [Rhodospirillaceae bacterium]|tara:strand:+ start:545 stop:1363 length:819 start_codon:yes stop_codon:yes gene_type:complete
MGIIQPTNKSVLALKGLHLYHTARSNCAARVRLLLEEKELAWTSHHIDLGKKENISEEYFGINPKGVVPTLVHDGEVVVESNDILVYLEENYPDPGFRDMPDSLQPEIDYWLQQSGDLHLPAIKTFQYYKINAALLPKTEEEEALYNKLQKDPDMAAFHSKHSQGKSFTEDDANGAIALLDAAFIMMNEAISDGGYIVGDAYTLADISWSPTITTLISGGFNFGPYPEVERWYETILERPQFQEAVIEWRKKATYAAGVDPTISGPAPATQN